ncbi:MAG: GNAT family N-acetyltransferase [Candidatus Thorarchaeota archaeon]|nr:GNAT family N-acetyltransferase [Candidatus Thorarchaeota archaeon]
MTAPSHIEIATHQDMPKIKSLLESVNGPIEGIDPDFTRFFVFRDETNKKILGCVGLEIFAGAALLRSLAIDPKQQGNKLGSKLINRRLSEAVDSGADTVYLCTAKAPSLTRKMGLSESIWMRSQAIYASLNYLPVGVHALRHS